MAEKKNEAQQQDAFDNNAGAQQQPATESAPADGGQSQQAATQQPLPPKDEDGLVKISQGLPPQLKPLQNCFTAPYKTFLQNGKDIRDLQRECNFAANALKNVVLTGMTLNPTLKLAYLVPYKGKVELQASYMGKKSFGVNTGLVLDMEAYLVYKGELFEIEQGSNAHITHKPNPWGSKKKEDILGGYYLIKYPNGTQQFDTMSIDEIEGIRKRSPSVGKGKQSPWDTDYTEMCKKTLINRAYKQIPKQGMTEKAAKALEILNRVDDMAAKDINYGQKSKFDDFDELEEEV